MTWIAHDIRVAGGTLTVHERPPAEGTRGSDALPLLLLHGFTGDGRTWSEVAEHLPDLHLLAPDLPGHGASTFFHEVTACNFEAAAKALVTMLDRLQVPRCHLMGYSMGGRLGLYLALEHPQQLASLLLESASPGLPDEAQRIARREADSELARFAIARGIEAFVQRWEAVPVLATEQRLSSESRRAQRQQRLSCRPSGLAASLLGMGTGSQPWLGNRLQELNLPVLLLAGGLDAKFRQIAVEMQRQIPGAEMRIVPETGHNQHLEAPRLVAAQIREFLYARQRTNPTRAIPNR